MAVGRKYEGLRTTVIDAVMALSRGVDVGDICDSLPSSELRQG